MLLARLEGAREHPRTLPLHDALYGLLRDPPPAGDTAAVAAARDRVLAALEGGHPSEAEVRETFGLPSAVRARDLAHVLGRIPDFPAREDPLEALELYLAAQRERIARLERSREELVQVVRRQGVLLSAAVGGATLLLILLALGWGLAPLWLGPGGPSASDLPEPPRSTERQGVQGGKP
ncbi:MAG: hypothetical protein ABIO70_25150 [Pseudomonadota bacterium]